MRYPARNGGQYGHARDRRYQRSSRIPLSKRWWTRLLAVVVALSAFSAVWAFLAPADWVRPQYLWNKPAPQVVTAEVVRRWPALGVDGATSDTVMLRVTGEPLPRSLRERGSQIAFYWRLDQSADSKWQLARRSGERTEPVAVPVSVANQGVWDIDVPASCPSYFRGFIEVVPVLASAGTYDRPPQGEVDPFAVDVRGNRILAETTGVTSGESPSPYRQVESLNANVPIAKFRDVLGRESSWSYLRGGREYLFITRDYCVQAVTDRHGLVVLYAVTALSDDFKPTFKYYGGDGSPEEVTLGETKFAECDSWGPPSSIWSYMYASNYCYSEAFYLPSAANSVTILLGNNYMGQPQLESFDGLMNIFGQMTRSQAKQAKAGRTVNTVNTFGVCAPDAQRGVPAQLRATEGWLGPNQWELGSTTLSDQSRPGGILDGLGDEDEEPTPEAVIVTEQANFNLLGGREYGYGVVLHNTSDYDANDVAVLVRFLGTDGRRLKTARDWISVIPARKTFYLGGSAYLPKGSAPETLRISAKADWSEPATQELLQATDLRIIDDYGATLEGRLTNASRRTLTTLSTVYYVLFAADGRVVSGGWDCLDSPVRPAATSELSIRLDESWTSDCRAVRVSVDAEYKGGLPFAP